MMVEMMKLLYVSLLDNGKTWIYQVAFNPDNEKLYITQGKDFDTGISKIAVYGDHLWATMGNNEVARLPLNDFNQIDIFPFYDKSAIFTDIIPTDGGTLLSEMNGKIYYLNPFGEYYHLRDLSVENPMVSGAVLLSIRPPVSLFQIGPSGFFILDSDNPENCPIFDEWQVSGGLLRDKDGDVLLVNREGVGYVVHGSVGDGAILLPSHLMKVTNPHHPTGCCEIPQKNKRGNAQLYTMRNNKIGHEFLCVIENGAVKHYLMTDHIFDFGGRILDATVDPRDWRANS